MKKFTFFFAMLFIVVLAGGQSKHNLREKILKIQEVHSRIMKQNDRFPASMTAFNGSYALKSAAAVQTLDSIVYQYYVQETETWLNVWNDEYQYNEEMRNTAYIEKEWNGTTNAWEELGRTELEYNENGQVSVMNIHSRDTTSGEFVLLNRVEAHYGPAGKLDSVLHYLAESPENWIEEARQIYHYNENDQLIQMDLTSLVEDEEGEYIQTMRFVYSYNSEGKMDTSSIYFIDPEMEILFSETSYMYDSSGRLTSSEDFALNFFTFEVEKSSRTEYEYNTDGDASIETTYWWDSSTEQWMEEYKDSYTYSDASFSEVIFPSYLQFWGVNEETNQFNKAVLEIVTTDWINNSWINSHRTLFYYSEDSSTGTRDLAQGNYSVFPNPAADKVTFRWNNYEPLTLEIYHLTGARISRQLITSGMEISVAELNNGVYLFKLLNKNTIESSGKLIKK